MARQKKTAFPPWQTTKTDGIENRYIRLGTILTHPAYIGLSDKAKVIYIHMLLESGGKREFIFPRSKYIKFCSTSAFENARANLIECGFIQLKQCNKNLRKPNLYEFSDQWKRYEPP